MARRQPRRQQTERGDDRKIDIVLHRHPLRNRIFIQLRDSSFIARIDFFDLHVFIDDLRLVIAQFIDLVRDLIEIRLPNDDAN